MIDACNPIGGGPPVNGVLSFFTTLKDSLMERLQKAYPRARFVKAFNSVGNGQMVNPQFAGGRPTMFICGNDAEAKRVVSQILDQFGWDAEDMGAVEAARAIEPLCMLWCIPGRRQGRLVAARVQAVAVGKPGDYGDRRPANSAPSPSLRAAGEAIHVLERLPLSFASSLRSSQLCWWAAGLRLAREIALIQAMNPEWRDLDESLP